MTTIRRLRGLLGEVLDMRVGPIKAICGVILGIGLVALQAQLSGAGPGQPPSASPSRAEIGALLSLPVTYASAQDPADYLQLNADRSFSLQEAGRSFHGTFAINGNSLELNIAETNISTTVTIQGPNLTDSSGQVWVLRREPAPRAYIAEIVKNQDVVRFVKAGLDDAIIIAKFARSRCEFDTSPEALGRLMQSGVSAAVIEAMVGSSGSAPRAQSGTTGPEKSIAEAEISQQAGATAAPVRMNASLKLPATFASAQNPGDQLQLNANHTFSLRQSYYGTFAVSSDRLELNIGKTNTKTTGVLRGVSLIDSSGQVWVLREQPAQLGPAAEVVKNSVELAAPHALGERNFVEFTVPKAKHAQCVGDISLRLIDVDLKYSRFTIEVTADDTVTEKKDKALNEPIQFYTLKAKQPYVIVVNKMDKDTITGYLSAPRDTIAKRF